jgi:hypothetical protein
MWMKGNKGVRVVQMVYDCAGRGRRAVFWGAASMGPALAAPAHGAPLDALMEKSADLGGLSPLFVAVLGLSLVLALIGLVMLIFRPRAVAGDEDEQIPIPMPDQRGPLPAAREPADANRSVRLSEAVAAARAKMTINEERDWKPDED